MTSPIGTRVKIRTSRHRPTCWAGRWGEIVAGPRKMFGDTKYQVRIDLQGLETVRQTVWLSASSLLVPKSTKEST